MKFAIGQCMIDIQIINFTNLTRSVEWKIDFPLMGKKIQFDGHYTENVGNPFQVSIEVWEDGHEKKSTNS